MKQDAHGRLVLFMEPAVIARSLPLTARHVGKNVG